MEDAIRELEERLINRHEGRNYNFFKPVGQIIEHVDVINFNMDKDGNFHFENVENVNVNKKKKEPSKEKLARAIENCQTFFWGNSSYAVLFCLFRDDYKMAMSKKTFETMIESLPFKKKRDFYCNEGTIANAFSDNPVFNSHVDEWGKTASNRILNLRDKLRKQLDL